MINGVRKNINYHPDDPSVVECQGDINANKCSSLWTNIERATVRANMYYKDWTKNWTQCHNH